MPADMLEAKPAKSRLWLYLLIALLVAALAALLLWLLLGNEPAPPAPDAAPADAAPADAGKGDARDAAPADVAPEAHANKPKARYRGHRLVSSAELRRLLRRHSGVIRLCYRRAARRLPSNAPRRANVVVDIAGAGRIRSVRVRAAGNRALAACVRRAVRAFRFPRAAKQQFVRFPVVVPH